MTRLSRTPLLGALLVLQRSLMGRVQHTTETAVTILMRVLYAFLGGRVWAEHRHRSFWHFVAILHMRAFEVGFAPYAVWRQVMPPGFTVLCPQSACSSLSKGHNELN